MSDGELVDLTEPVVKKEKKLKTPKEPKEPKAPKGSKGKLRLAVNIESLGAPVAGIAKPKRTRAPTAYNTFVKNKIKSEEIRALPANQRFKAVAAAYKALSADERARCAV
jgi:hypothetical protein